MSNEETKVEEVKEEKKAPREYKGEVVDAASITEIGTPIQAIETTVPFPKSQWNNGRDQKVPRLFVITGINVSPYGGDQKYMTYASHLDEKNGAIYVPNDFKFRKLTGTQGEDMTKKYRTSLSRNLEQHVRVGMTIGSDPEIFVEDENGTVIPAFNFLADKKSGTTRTRGVTYGNLPMYWDGFQAEFETSPQTCLAWQVDSVQAGLYGVYHAAKKFNKNAKLSTRTVMEIPFDMLQNSAEEHVTFGCMPSFNVYGLKGKEVAPRDLPFRTAGGHIHFGVGKIGNVEQIIRALDAVMGVACVSMFANFDNPIRRQSYGMAGEYRLPAHGIEYRVLSNAWLIHPMIMNLVFDVARNVLGFGHKGFLPLWNTTQEETIDVVQNCDVPRARAILERNKTVLLKLIKASYGYVGDTGLEKLYGVFFNGLETAVKDPNDIVGNWNLNGSWIGHSDGKDKNVRYSVESLTSGKQI